MLKKDFSVDDGEMSSKDRREKVLQRISEYERFEANCQKIKKLNKNQRVELSREVINIHNNMLDNNLQSTDLRSLPQAEVSLPQRIQLWRMGGGLVRASRGDRWSPMVTTATTASRPLGVKVIP